MATNLFDQTDRLEIDAEPMLYLLSEMHEKEGNFDRSEVDRALTSLRLTLNKIGPEQLGILWLRKD